MTRPHILWTAERRPGRRRTNAAHAPPQRTTPPAQPPPLPASVLSLARTNGTLARRSPLFWFSIRAAPRDPR